MPIVRKLAPDEVQTIENKGKGLRKISEEQYDRFLADFAVGEYGEAELDPDDKRLTVRNRLKAAARARRGPRPEAHHRHHHPLPGALGERSSGRAAGSRRTGTGAGTGPRAGGVRDTAEAQGRPPEKDQRLSGSPQPPRGVS